MKKILVLTSTFPFNSNHNVPDFVKTQIKGLKKQYPDLYFKILCPNISQNIKKEETDSYELIAFNYFWPKKYQTLTEIGILPSIKKNFLNTCKLPLLIIFQLINTVKICKNFKPDYIYVHWFTPQAIIAYFASILLKIPYGFTSHSQDVVVLTKIPIFGKILINKIVKRSHANSTVSIATNLKLKSCVSEDNWIENKNMVLPMPIPDYTPKKKNRISETFKILFIGRLVEKKGVELLIRAFNKIDDLNITLTIAGEGPKAKYLKSISENNVSFVGYVSGNEKDHLISNTDLIVIPSIISKDGDSEGLPVVVLESLIRRKLVLASYDSNAGEIIENGSNGFLFNSNNEEEFIKIIKKISSLDSNKRASIEKNAYELGTNYQISSLGPKYYDHFFKDLN